MNITVDEQDLLNNPLELFRDSEMLGTILYFTEKQKIIKQPLLYNFRFNLFYATIPVKSFIIGALTYKNEEKPYTTNFNRFDLNYLNPVEIYHMIRPLNVTMDMLSKDDFRNENETFIFRFE